MSSSKKELEEKLKEAGNSLLKPPSNTDELLKLLDEVEGLLSDVGQAPCTSLQDALLPAMTALISDVLLRHSDTDVKVSVTSCITEVTRITAPDAPYDDNKMKEIFKLTVAASENLSHLSSRSYKKAVSILKVIAKVRSSVMMLDLECYEIIAEMFQLFLNIIQSNHPLAVFSDMQNIMTMVLEEIHESEEFPLELLRILLLSVTKKNQIVSPFSWKLGETVLDNCAAKLKPYLMEAVKSLGTALDDYAPIVASICQHRCDALKIDHVRKNLGTEVVTANAAGPTTVDKCVAGPTSDEPKIVHDPFTTLQRCHLANHSKEVNLQDGAEPDNSFSVKTVKSVNEPDSGTTKRGKRPRSSMDPEEISEIEPHSALKKRGRKPNSLMNPEEGYDNHWMQSGKKSPKSAGNRNSHDKGSDSLSTEDHLHLKVTMASTLPSTLQEVTEPSTLPSTHQQSTESPNSQPKAEGDIGSASLRQQNGHLDGTESRRGRPRKQVAIAHQEANPTSHSPAKVDFFSCVQAEDRNPGSIDTLKMESKETSSLKAKSRGRPRKFPAKTNNETIIASVHVGTESAVSCDPVEKQQESASTLGTVNINDQSAVQKVGTQNVSATKPRGRPRKLASKINQETVLASERIVITEVSPVPSGPEQNMQRDPAVQFGTGGIKDRSAGKGIQTLGGEDAPSKDGAEGSLNKKMSNSETNMGGDKNVVIGTPKIIRKRKRSIAKDEANPMPNPDDRIVGKGIQVWWPKDKTFYDGVVRSYDAVRQRHLVLYNDGEKENLNLRKQRWQLIEDDSKDSCIQLEQKNDTPKTDASVRPQKRKRKAISEPSEQANAGFSLKRNEVSAGLSTVECMKSDSKSADRSTLSEPIIDEQREDKSKETDRLMDDKGEIYAGQLKGDMKTGIDSMQITPETITLSKEENPKVDIGPSVNVDPIEMTGLSNGVKDAS
ncbi:sister chromatid cohesion protein PDS5 homolog D isoform X2 [Argentina anserina]|uniref:sister chromatid cohesion protein PDS5 homolog D isoform X2 n=1 Tax=Argentina anserina TaxID=57926 RepID=UPI002176650F|nr:sister chromatid cohesion protein PDS5 homolog D-like isoform X2 [Potentilla anserina]